MEQEGFWQEHEEFRMNIAKPKAGAILCKLVWEGVCWEEQHSSYYHNQFHDQWGKLKPF